LEAKAGGDSGIDEENSDNLTEIFFVLWTLINVLSWFDDIIDLSEAEFVILLYDRVVDIAYYIHFLFNLKYHVIKIVILTIINFESHL
jgi:hypothetical protein